MCRAKYYSVRKLYKEKISPLGEFEIKGGRIMSNHVNNYYLNEIRNINYRYMFKHIKRILTELEDDLDERVEPRKLKTMVNLFLIAQYTIQICAWFCLMNLTRGGVSKGESSENEDNQSDI